MTWKTLETASGPATRVPQQVKAIISGDAQKRAQGVHALLTTLVQSGRWFSASAPTTDLILRSVADAPPDAPGAGRALWLALDIATAINEDFLRGLHSWQTAPEADECRKVIEQAQPRLLRLLTHDDPSVRAPAAALLALGQGDRDAAARALGARRTVETDPFALAHLLLASGFLHLFAGERHPGLASELTPFLADDQPDLVRTAAALAHLASTHDLSPAAAKALPAALHQHLRPDTVGWCDGRWPHLVAAVARRLGDVAPVLTRALREDLEDSELYSTNQKRYWARIALDAARLDVDYDPWANTPVRDLDDFSPPQQEIIRELAPFFIEFTGTGVPRGRRARLRWLGVAPPGVLEQLKEWTVDGETVRWPLWKIWQHERSEGPPPAEQSCLPPTVAAVLTDAERAEALLETCDFSYDLSRRFSADEEKLVTDHVVTDHANDRLVQVLREILDDHTNEPASEPTFSARPLDLWAARGSEIPPAWDWYVRWEVREHMALLPIERREARVLADPLPEDLTSNDADLRLSDVIGILDLVPTPRLLTWVFDAIAAQRAHCLARGQSLGNVDAAISQLLELAETVPEVKAALDDARRTHDWIPEAG